MVCEIMRKDIIDLIDGLVNENDSSGDTVRNNVRHATARPNRNEGEDMLASGFSLLEGESLVVRESSSSGSRQGILC